MSNTETKTTSSAIGQIDSTGAIGAITVKGGKLVDISIEFATADTFTGTIVLERTSQTGAANIENWQAVESYTGTVEKVARSAATRKYRLNCTTDSGGTALYELTAGNFN